MRVTVNVQDGAHAGRRVELSAPARFSIGRSTAADWAFPEDRYLSNRHFEIAYENEVWVLRDLDSANGTFIDGKRVIAVQLTRECSVMAGQTTFVIVPDLSVKAMLARSQPLYAILDAARTPRVLELLGSATECFACLYNGESAVRLAACAPYLIELPPRSRLLRKLAREGWGRSWGIFLTCKRPFEEVRNHFRHFLMVKDEAGADYYFRFYDPRVLRAFLHSCTQAEANEFLGPVSQILYERGTGMALYPNPHEVRFDVPA